MVMASATATGLVRIPSEERQVRPCHLRARSVVGGALVEYDLLTHGVAQSSAALETGRTYINPSPGPR